MSNLMTDKNLAEINAQGDKNDTKSEGKMFTTRPIFPAYSDFPILHTSNPKVHLRPMHKDDLAAFHELRQQWDVMQYTSKQDIDRTLDETQTWLARFIAVEKNLETQQQKEEVEEPNIPIENKIEEASMSTHNFGFSIVYSESAIDAEGIVVGTGGIHTITPEPEIGYMIRREYWGKGIGSVSVQALLDAYWELPRRVIELDPRDVQGWVAQPEKLSDTTLSLSTGVYVTEHLKAEIVHTNKASIRVCEKMGFIYTGDHPVEENGEMVTLFVYAAQRDLRRNAVVG